VDLLEASKHTIKIGRYKIMYKVKDEMGQRGGEKEKTMTVVTA
jgi:hypothetical protein